LNGSKATLQVTFARSFAVLSPTLLPEYKEEEEEEES